MNTQNLSRKLIAIGIWGLMACNVHSFRLQDGDLLFHVGKGSNFEESISAATRKRGSLPFTHVGVADSVGKYVWEAVPEQGVRQVPVEDFLQEALQVNGHPVVVVFRLKKRYQKLLHGALERIRALEHKPYDYLFQANNEAYYCSELVQQTFLDKNGQPLFPAIEMNFADSQTGALLPYWKEYFDKYALPVPQGAPGSNPINLSQSSLLKRVHAY